VPEEIFLMTDSAASWEFLVPFSAQHDLGTTAVSAKGTRVTMADGRRLLCGTSGLWNVNFGYGQPAVTEAIAAALREASYLTLFRYGHPWAERAARGLVDRCGPARFGKVLFSTSGGAANDLTMKLVRHAAILRGERARRLVVGLKGSYHGLMYGSHGLTGEALGQQEYAVDQRLVRHVDPACPAELAELCDREGDRICGLFLEPVLGTGALEVSEHFLDEAFRLADQYGFAIVADEVATGFYRTGPLRASAAWQRQPDIVILSKGLTNGTCAAAAVVVSETITNLFQSTNDIFIHAETQAGTPATCAAIDAVLSLADELDAEQLSARLSEQLDAALAWITERHGSQITASGRGCFRCIHIDTEGGPLDPVQQALLIRLIRDAGAIVHPGLHGIQLVPSLAYSDEDVYLLRNAVTAGLDALLGAPSPALTA
jgi:adenosylmethionine-8-amino-7-oxononanoate aminotransferase